MSKGDKIGPPTVWRCVRQDCSYEASSMTYGRFGPVKKPRECPNCGNVLAQENHK